ncbi:MAG: ATP-binding protein [Hydrogenothermaceae bacterium]|nr:ATP-binding protein [Hydrogenothermaceae bacterium]
MNILNCEEILESITDPVVIISKEGKILFENQEAKNFASLSGVQSLEALLKDVLKSRYISEGFNIKGMYRRFKDKDLEIDGYIYRDSIIVVIRDITRYIKLEEDLKKEGKIQIFSKLLAELFHDLKGPISGIKAAAQYFKENPSEIEMIDDIINDIGRIERFLKEVTSLTRPLNLVLRNENIHKIIDKTVIRYETIYPTVKIKRLYDPSLPDIPIDEDYFLRVLENLIQNSVDAINSEGEIIIETGISDDMIYSPRRDKIYIRIKDSGKGVPEDIIDKIFLPFFSTKEGGTGVGLSNAFNIVKSHGGILRYIGNSTFEILLPIR